MGPAVKAAATLRACMAGGRGGQLRRMGDISGAVPAGLGRRFVAGGRGRNVATARAARSGRAALAEGPVSFVMAVMSAKPSGGSGGDVVAGWRGRFNGLTPLQ